LSLYFAGSGNGPRPIYGATPVQNCPMPINNNGIGAGYGQPQQQAYDEQRGYLTNYNFDPDLSNNVVTPAGNGKFTAAIF